MTTTRKRPSTKHVLPPLAVATGALLKAFFGGAPGQIFSKKKGSPKHAFFRQWAIYAIHVEGNIDEAGTAEIMQRDRSTVRYAARAFEDAREDPDIDEALREFGSALVKLSVMSTAFSAATVDFGDATGRRDWIRGLKAAGKALRTLSEAPPEEVRARGLDPKEVEALLENAQIKKLLKGVRFAPPESADDLTPWIEAGKVEDGRRTLRIVNVMARVKADVLAAGKAALMSAGMRIVFADVMRGPGGRNVVLFKVANVGAENTATPKMSALPHKSDPKGR
jgi:hypothetical protein